VNGTGTESSAAGAGTPPGVPASGGRNGFLSDVIVELGFATQETVERAVRAARSPGTTVGRVLVDMNAISEEQLARAMAERYGIDYIELDGFQIDPGAANLIKPAAAQRYQAVPVAFLGQVLLVAMGDPADSVGVTDIAAMTARTVQPAVASRPALQALLRALPLDEKQAAPRAEAAEAQVALPEAPAPAAPPPPADGAEARLRGSEAQDALEAAELSDRPGLRAQLADAEVGLEHARQLESELRRIRADVDLRHGELESLRARLTDAETELVRVRAELDTRRSELQVMRMRAESAETETESAARRVAPAERDPRATLRDEETRRAELEQRLSEVESAGFAAERAFEELRLAQGRMRGALGELTPLEEPSELGEPRSVE